MDNNFLLTFSYENEDGKIISSYEWHEDKNELFDEIDYKKETLKNFEVNEVMEILNVRTIEI